MIKKYIRKLFYNLKNDRSGNFGLLTALVLPILIPVAGMALDFSGMMNARAKMRDASDAASLAAASAMTQNDATADQAKAIALRYLKGHSEANVDLSAGAQIFIETTGPIRDKTFKVTVIANYQYPVTPLTRLLIASNQPITSKSVSISTQKVDNTKNPASMFMVLDRSGSMKYPTTELLGYDADNKPIYRSKIDALKLAVVKMSDILHKVDPTWKYVRAGAVAFSTDSLPSTNMEFGTTTVLNYVNGLKADGNTNPVEAIGTATSKLLDPAEDAAQLAKNGGVPTKWILYLTDGQNNPKELDTPALEKCQAAKNAGIEIYTVGFMMFSGKYFLAKCATDDKHFFDVSNAAELYATFEKIGYEIATTRTNRIGE